jgi:hypothetical protein
VRLVPTLMSDVVVVVVSAGAIVVVNSSSLTVGSIDVVVLPLSDVESSGDDDMIDVGNVDVPATNVVVIVVVDNVDDVIVVDAAAPIVVLVDGRIGARCTAKYLRNDDARCSIAIGMAS